MVVVVVMMMMMTVMMMGMLSEVARMEWNAFCKFSEDECRGPGLSSLSWPHFC